MCLGFTFAAAAPEDVAERAMKTLHEHHVDCNNIQHIFLGGEDGTTWAFLRLPATSSDCVLYMYPIDAADLGPGAAHLVPSTPLPCGADMLHAIQHPGDFVPLRSFVQMPIFRSLGGGGGDEHAQAAITLPEGACVINTDGSASFTLPTSGVVLTDADLDRAVADGRFRDRVDYLRKMGDACFAELTRNMQRHGVDAARVFALDAEGRVDPGAKIGFLDQLLPNLRPGKDLLVGVPAFDEAGRPKAAAFSLFLRFPAGTDHVPLLGLLHNVDPASTEPDVVVEEDFYVVTNRAAELHVPGAEPLALRGHEAFRPSTTALSTDDYDVGAYERALVDFQARCNEELVKRLRTVLPDEVARPLAEGGELRTVNLKHARLPRETTRGTLSG